MEKNLVSVLLLILAVGHTLAKDTITKDGKRDTKETKETKIKLPQTLSRGKKYDS